MRNSAHIDDTHTSARACGKHKSLWMKMETELTEEEIRGGGDTLRGVALKGRLVS